MMETTTRAAALERGLKRYCTGKACPAGHVAERYVSTMSCVECMRLSYKARKPPPRARPAQVVPAAQEWTGQFTCIEEVDEYLDAETLTCLLCGRAGLSNLTLHLEKLHGLRAAEYRQRYRIPASRGLLGAAARRRKQAKVKAQGIGRWSAVAAPAWDRFLERVRAGETATSLYGQPGMPTFGQCNWRRKSDRSFRDEMASLMDGRPGGRFTTATIKAVCSGLVAGHSMNAISASLGRTASLTRSLHRRMKSDPVLAAQFDEVWSTRQVAGLRRRHIADWEGFEQRLRSGERLRDVLGSGGSMPTHDVWHGERRRNSELRERIDLLLADARRRRGAQRTKLISPAQSLERYNTALRSDEIYGAVHAAAGRLPPDIRDDVMSDLVLALMCGEMQVVDLPREVGRYRAAHNRAFGQWTPSLDAPVFEGRAIGDTLSAAYF